MQVFSNFEDLPEVYNGCVIALGTFDGIHLGHLDIINTAREYAKKKATKVVVFSFSNHPLDLISPEKTPPRLCSEEKKKELLEALNVDVLFNMHFDAELASVSSAQFVLNMQSFFSPGCLVVGDNYSYGYLGAGTAQTLISDGQKYGFDVIVRKLVTLDDIIVSSTNIRNFILQGNIKTANKLLAREYSLDGIVVDGDKRGRKLGFPTANLQLKPANQTVPADGVYACHALIADKCYKAVASIGQNPTFDGIKGHRIEAYLLDFNQDIYGEELELFFFEKIRDEKKFVSVSELIEKIKEDVAYVRKI